MAFRSSLNVLYQSHLHRILVFHADDVGRNLGQTGQLRGPPAAFTGNNLVLLPVHLAQRDGLNDAQFTDAAGQLLQGFLVELAAWLVGVGLYLCYLYLAQVRATFSLHLAMGVYQRIQSLSQTHVVQSSSQHVTVVFLLYSHISLFTLYSSLVDNLLGQCQMVLGTCRVCIIEDDGQSVTRSL